MEQKEHSHLDEEAAVSVPSTKENHLDDETVVSVTSAKFSRPKDEMQAQKTTRVPFSPAKINSLKAGMQGLSGVPAKFSSPRADMEAL